MNKDCNIIKDLTPLFAEDLTSEESNTFIHEHIQSCESCKKYIENMKSDLPNEIPVDLESDQDDRILMKGVKRNLSRMIWLALLTGVLFSTYSPMMLFPNLNDDTQTILVIYPIVTFLFGMVSYILVKRIWAGPVITLLSGLISTILFAYFSPLIWILAYTLVSLLGGFVGLAIEKIKYKLAKNTIKGIIITASIVLALISLLLFSFLYGMVPKQSEEKKVIAQAEEYLEEKYSDENFEIYDVLYDNMGNHSHFDYAAKVRNKVTGEDFLVYYHSTYRQMVDTRESD